MHINHHKWNTIWAALRCTPAAIKFLNQVMLFLSSKFPNWRLRVFHLLGCQLWNFTSVRSKMWNHRQSVWVLMSVHSLCGHVQRWMSGLTGGKMSLSDVSQSGQKLPLSSECWDGLGPRNSTPSIQDCGLVYLVKEAQASRYPIVIMTRGAMQSFIHEERQSSGGTAHWPSVQKTWSRGWFLELHSGSATWKGSNWVSVKSAMGHNGAVCWPGRGKHVRLLESPPFWATAFFRGAADKDTGWDWHFWGSSWSVCVTVNTPQHFTKCRLNVQLTTAVICM